MNKTEKIALIVLAIVASVTVALAVTYSIEKREVERKEAARSECYNTAMINYWQDRGNWCSKYEGVSDPNCAIPPDELGRLQIRRDDLESYCQRI